MSSAKQIAVGLLLAAAALPAVASPRLLVESSAVKVFLERDLRCGHQAQLRVESQDPAVFSGHSARLQAAVDAARAVLGFECRDIPELAVSGEISGLGGESYFALENGQSDWKLKPTRTTSVAPLASAGGGHSSTAGQAVGGPAGANGQKAEPSGSSADGQGFVVRGLQLGLDVGEAQAALGHEFKSAAHYDASKHVLSVVDGGCAIAGDVLKRSLWPGPGDSCLEAHFENRELVELRYAQIVDQDQAAAIEQALVRRYGEPASKEKSADGGVQLAWGAPLPGDAQQRELEADVSVHRGSTLLVLRLQTPKEEPRYHATF